jgi:hypothetical protein
MRSQAEVHRARLQARPPVMQSIEAGRRPSPDTSASHPLSRVVVLAAVPNRYRESS